jgi:hypothetical protein
VTAFHLQKTNMKVEIISYAFWKYMYFRKFLHKVDCCLFYLLISIYTPTMKSKFSYYSFSGVWTSL